MAQNYVDLPYPHGFRVWKGKKTTVLSNEELEPSCLVITGDEAFGYAKLASNPIQLTLSGLNGYDSVHEIEPHNVKLFYDSAKPFYIYTIESFEPFTHTKLFRDGKVYHSNALPKGDYEKYEQLPKSIILDDAAVLLNNGFQSSVACDELNRIIKSVYGDSLKEIEIDEGKPIYQLALIKSPVYRLNNIKKKDSLMPWEIVTDNAECNEGEYAVVKEGTTELEGCHETRDEAESQMAALYASENEMKESDQSDGQVDIKEMSLSQYIDFVRGQFDAQFQDLMEEYSYWIRDIYDSYVIAEYEGNLYRVSYLEANESILFMPMENWQPVELEYVDKAAKHLWSKEIKAEPSETFLQKAKRAARWLLMLDEDKKQVDLPDIDTPYGMAIKNVGGIPWHFTWSTNAFKDREGEIFATQALENFVLENEQKEDKGTFDFWHIPYTDFAAKEWQAVIGRFLIEAGPYFENETGQRAKEFFTKYPNGHKEIAPEGWGASPEFVYLPEDRQDSVYDWLHITKTSTLPRSAAANIYTKGSQIMNDQQRKAAMEIFGNEFVQKLEADAQKQTENLQGQGIEHKSKTEIPKEEAPKTEQSKPIEIDYAQLAEAMSKQFNADVAPLQEQIIAVAESVKALAYQVEELQSKERVAKEQETPRFVLQMVDRASQSNQTAVKENDDLLGKSPKQNNGTNGQFSLSEAYFPKG